MKISSVRNLVLLTAMVALALGLAVFSSTTRTAQADGPFDIVTAGLLTVHKHCVPEDATGTFNVTLDFDFTFSETPTTPPDDPNEDFDVDFTISCSDDSTETEPNDGDTVTFGDGTGDINLADLFDWYADNVGIITGATATVTEGIIPGVITTYADNFEGTCEFDQGDIESFVSNGVACLITNEISPPNIVINKEVTEDTDLVFEYTLTTDAEPGCRISVDGGAIEVIEDGGTFELSGGQSAELWCPPGSTNTITETLGDDFELLDIGCSADGEGGSFETDVPGGSVDIIFTSDIIDAIVICTFENEPAEDNPDIIVKKECVGLDGTFTINVGGAATELSQDVECGESVTFPDLEPGQYTIDEIVGEVDTGDDCNQECNPCGVTCDPCGVQCEEQDGGIDTLIACSDLQQVDGTSVTVDLVDVDIFCVFINSDEKLDVCPCRDTIEIDTDNTNTNVIGIENENENTNTNNNTNNNSNNNTNTNTQNQTNDQSQNNSNTQTNNIDSSPEVNIDFD
jgi:hypothetical protein